LTSLAAANALFALGAERRSALWIAEAAPYAPLVEEKLDLTFPEESPMLRAERDFAAFGTSLAEHPARIIKKEHWLYPFAKENLLTAQQLLKQPANLIIKVFGMVLVRQAPSTAKGMVFITLEDETGFLNLAFTPQIYERYSTMINSQGFLCVEGRLQKPMADHGNSILVKKVYSPQLPQADVIPIEHEDKIIAITRKTLARTRNYM
jgi:error-prone DNA polymerase